MPAETDPRVLRLLDDLIEDVGNLRVAVARLEEKVGALSPKPTLARDGGLTVSSGALGAIVLAVIQHFAK